MKRKIFCLQKLVVGVLVLLLAVPPHLVAQDKGGRIWKRASPRNSYPNCWPPSPSIRIHCWLRY